MCTMWAELVHVDGQTDGRAHRHDGIHNGLSKFCERA
jgi:hypothetical protein